MCHNSHILPFVYCVLLGVAYQPNHPADNYTAVSTVAVYRVFPVSTVLSRADLLWSLYCAHMLQLTICTCVR